MTPYEINPYNKILKTKPLKLSCEVPVKDTKTTYQAKKKRLFKKGCQKLEYLTEMVREYMGGSAKKGG